MQLLSALPRCASSTVSDVGYPSNCGVVYGSFGDPRAHEDGHGRFFAGEYQFGNVSTLYLEHCLSLEKYKVPRTITS